MKRFNATILYFMVIFSFIIYFFNIPPILFGQEKPEKEKTTDNTKKIELKPLPQLQLEHLEKAVRNQLIKGRKMVDSIPKDSIPFREKLSKAYGDLGQLYHAYELNKAAEICYHNALILSPTYLEWRYSLGYLLQTTGRYEEALDAYKKMNNNKLSLDLAYLRHIRIGECYRSLNQLENAKKSFEKAYELNPGGPAVLARLGVIALDEKQYIDAIKYIEAALKKQPDANRLYYTLGMAYRGIGNMDEAREYMSKRGMVGIQPPDPVKSHLKKLVTGYWTHLLAGKLAYSAKRYNEAIEAFKKAIETNPEKPEAKINLGATLTKLGKYKEAIVQFQEAIKIDPKNEVTHFNLGTLYAHLGNYSKAREHLEFVVEKTPKDPEAHFQLANAFKNEDQSEKAIEHYTTALKLKPDMTSAWLDLSQLFSKKGRHAEALQVLETAHEQLPFDGLIAHDLARLLAGSPDIKKRDGKRALELAMRVFHASKHYDHAKTIAMAYAELNQCDKAVEWMELAIKIATNAKQPNSVLEILKRNLDHFKTQRPCRVPGKK